MSTLEKKRSGTRKDGTKAELKDHWGERLNRNQSRYDNLTGRIHSETEKCTAPPPPYLSGRVGQSGEEGFMCDTASGAKQR